MPAIIGTIGTIVKLNQAVNGNAASNAVYASQINAGEAAAIAAYNSQLTTASNSTLADSLMINLSLTAAAGVNAASLATLKAAIIQALEAYPASKGQVIANLGNLLSNLESDATWASAALAFNNQTAANYSYSVNPSSVTSGSPSATSSFTLTTGTDNIPGTSSNDVINATIVTGTAASTFLNVSDIINLAGGTADTININYAGTAATASLAALPVLTNVEVLNLSKISGASTMVGTVAPSLTHLGVAGNLATGALTVTAAVATMTTITLENNSFDDNDLSVTYAAGAFSGTTDSLTLNLAAMSSATTATGNTYAAVALIGPVAGSGLETINVNSSSTSRLDSLTSTDGATQTMTTLNVTGAGSFRVNTALDFKGTTGTVNASTNTGGVTLSVGTENLTITGGTGADSITFGTAGDLDANDSVTLGDGVDTIVVADTAMSSSTTALNTAINATGAEVVGFSAAASVDMAQVTAAIVAMASSAAATLTVTKLLSTDTVRVNTGTNVGSDLTVSGSLGFTTANLVLNGSSTASVSIDDLTAQNLATVNIASNGTFATVNTIADLILSDQAVVTVTGPQGLTITNALANTAVVINGSAMEKALSVTAGTTASSLVGGAGADALTGGTGADTISGGAGVDTINTGVDGAVGTTITGGTGADAITSGHVAANAATIAFNATAAESFIGATATGTSNADSLTLGDLADTGTTVVTFTTGVTPTSQTGAITALAAASPPTIGTTTVSAGGFIVYNSVAEADGATAPVFVVYQDTDGDGVIENLEFAVRIIGSTDASDTEAFAVTAGKLVFTLTGA